MYKISEGAAKLLMRGWYRREEFSFVEAELFANEWLKEATEGEVFDLEEADLVRKIDGIYVVER